MKQIQFPNGKTVPALGQGTWHMGRDSTARKEEADALRHGMDLGMTLIDTAEMYHDAELVVAEALKGRRHEAWVVSKVLPANASFTATVAACETSLKRLDIECIDLYLLHWPGSYPLRETLGAFQALVEQGKIGGYGVSNFDIAEMQDAWTTTGGDKIATNQLFYNLQHRAIEWDLLPWCRQKRLPVMAYSPLNQGRLDSAVLDQIAERHNATRFQVALAWVLHQHQVIAIPKSSKISHLDQNHAALDIRLSEQDLQQIDQAFAPPSGPVAIEMTGSAVFGSII